MQEVRTNIEAHAWVGLFGPSGMSADLAERFHAASVKALADPATRQRLEQIGAVPVGNTPAQFAVQLRADLALWARAVKQAGIKVE